MPHLVAAPDKFRGTATASEVAGAIDVAAVKAGWTCDRAPVADGGEGLLDALQAHLGGARRRLVVTGPLGRPAVVEMARASGLLLAGGPEGNDPMEATTRGTGELISAAVSAGARRGIGGLGGSATTDGGQGALQVLQPARLVGIELIVACDVTTTFTDAAREFGPQKGAPPGQVALLTRRLERLADLYRGSGVDVTTLPGAGAAGGLAGGLATVGGVLTNGFELVADVIDLRERVGRADLVVTGEGRVDEWSFRGKAVGGVVEIADDAGVEVLVVAGTVLGDPPLAVQSLVDRFGSERAMADPGGCVAELVAAYLEV